MADIKGLEEDVPAGDSAAVEAFGRVSDKLNKQDDVVELAINSLPPESIVKALRQILSPEDFYRVEQALADELDSQHIAVEKIRPLGQSEIQDFVDIMEIEARERLLQTEKPDRGTPSWEGSEEERTWAEDDSEVYAINGLMSWLKTGKTIDKEMQDVENEIADYESRTSTVKSDYDKRNGLTPSRGHTGGFLMARQKQYALLDMIKNDPAIVRHKLDQARLTAQEASSSEENADLAA